MEWDRALRAGFEAALAGHPAEAQRLLPLVIEKPWLEEVEFRGACALARSAPPETADLASRLVLAVGLHNPALALRESAQYLTLPAGEKLFERFALSAPDEAMSLAAGAGATAHAVRERMASGPAELAVLARLAGDISIDLPRRGRAAILAVRIARGELSYAAALKLADSVPQFFAAAVDMRIAAGRGDVAALDRALENESLIVCRAAEESLERVMASDLARFRSIDLYLLLALGRAEATPRVFGAVFDRLLLPRWKSAARAESLTALLDRVRDWELRDFAAGALAAGRFPGLLGVAGNEIVTRLSRGIDQARDPLKEAMRLAEIVDATGAPALRQQMAGLIAAEFARCRDSGDARCATLYGLLAAKLSVAAMEAEYLPFFRETETLDTALLYGHENLCVERYFFYDDGDGVESYHSFRKSYERDPAWQLEDRGEYLHLTGRGPEGRRVEIFANVPIDGHLPQNQGREGEAARRQKAIAAALGERSLVPSVMVHRGHSFWVARTLSYLEKSARLVILGSCGGATEIHAVIEASHDAQVIATRGVGETEINDAIMKAVNDRILKGERTLVWNSFWQELRGRWGKSALFREYLAPNRDAGTVFLRAYHRYVDTAK